MQNDQDQDDGLQVDLFVDSVSPASNARPMRIGRDSVNGTVTFVIKIPHVVSDLALTVPYFDASSVDAGIKEAATYLAGIAEAISNEARSLAESDQDAE